MKDIRERFAGRVYNIFPVRYWVGQEFYHIFGVVKRRKKTKTIPNSRAIYGFGFVLVPPLFCPKMEGAGWGIGRVGRVKGGMSTSALSKSC